jgi:hypothetical protein
LKVGLEELPSSTYEVSQMLWNPGLYGSFTELALASEIFDIEDPTQFHYRLLSPNYTWAL